MYGKNAIIYCGLGFLQMILILCIGLLLLRIFRIQIKTPFQELFCAMCTGVYACILITAFVFTQGKTVFTGTLPLVLLLFWIYRPDTENIKAKSYYYSFQQVLKYFSVITGIWLWTYMLNIYCISTDGSSMYLPHFDILHSIEISQNIQQTGTETYYWWQNNPKTFPYHYAEIWLHAGIQTLWHTQKTWTWQGMVMPLLQSILITGLLGIAEQHQKKINIFFVLTGCSFILFQGWLNFSLPYFDTHFDFTRYISMAGTPKFIVIGIFCVLYIVSENTFRPFILLLLPIFSVLTLPAISVWILLIWIQTKSKTVLLGFFFLIIWLTGFYLVTGKHGSFDISVIELVPEINSYFWKTNVYFVLVSIVFYLPVFFWVREKMVFKHFAVIFGVSYILFFVFYRWYDSYQFLVLLWIPLLWTYSWVIFINMPQRYVKVWFWCVAGLGLVQTLFYKRDFQRTAVDNAWIHEIYTYLDKHNLLQQGAALEYYDVRQLHVFAWQKKNVKLIPLLAQPIEYDGITQKLPADTLTASVMQKILPFQLKNRTISVEEQVFSFCRQRNIRFLIYPSEYKFEKIHKEYILHHFENTQNKLSCIVWL